MKEKQEHTSPCWTRMIPPPSFCLLLLGALGVFALGHFTKGQKISTLIFTKGNTIRNCSCPVDIRDCDYSLANLMCSCQSVLPFTMEQTSYHSHLTIWFTDPATLGHLLKFTLVQDLKLSRCGSNTLPTKFLAVCGLRRLRISTEAKHPSREQSLLIHNRREGGSSYKGWQTCLTFAVSVCCKSISGCRCLKADQMAIQLGTACMQRPEEGVRFPGTGVMTFVSCMVGVGGGTPTWVLWI